MFTFLAISAIILVVGTIPVVMASLFGKPSRNNLVSDSKLLSIAVDVEKLRSLWRAHHEMLDRDA